MFWMRIGLKQSRDSSVGMATGYGLDDAGIALPCPGRGNNFHFFVSSRPALGPTQPPIQWVIGALSPGVKRPRRYTNHSPPISAEVKKTTLWRGA
jgi:hypothetical protein